MIALRVCAIVGISMAWVGGWWLGSVVIEAWLRRGS